MNVIVAWFLTLSASVVIIAVFLSAYFKKAYGKELKLANEQMLDYSKAYRMERDANVVLKQRYRTLRATTIGDSDE